MRTGKDTLNCSIMFRPKYILLSLVLLAAAYQLLAPRKFELNGFPKLEPGVYLLSADASRLPKFLNSILLAVPKTSATWTLFFPSKLDGPTQSISVLPLARDSLFFQPLKFSISGREFSLAAEFREQQIVARILEIDSNNDSLSFVQKLKATELPNSLAESGLLELALNNLNFTQVLHETEIKSHDTLAEREKIEALASGSEVYKSRLENKRNELLAQLSDLNRQAAVLRRGLVELEKKVTLAQRLTPQGKLVSLSRESLDQDADWIAQQIAKRDGQ